MLIVAVLPVAGSASFARDSAGCARGMFSLLSLPLLEPVYMLGWLGWLGGAGVIWNQYLYIHTIYSRMADRTSRLKEMLRRSGLLEFASLLEMLALRTAKNLADLTPREMEETIKLIPAKRAGMNDDITDSMRFAPGHFRNLRELRAQCKKIACAPVIDAATAAMEHVGEGGSMVSRERQLTFTARVVDPKIVKGAGEASAMTSNLQEREQWSGGTVQAWRQQLSQATAVLQEAVDSLQNALQHLRREPPCSRARHWRTWTSAT